MFLFPLPLLLMELARYFIKLLISQMQTTSRHNQIRENKAGKSGIKPQIHFSHIQRRHLHASILFYLYLILYCDQKKKRARIISEPETIILVLNQLLTDFSKYLCRFCHWQLKTLFSPFSWQARYFTKTVEKITKYTGKTGFGLVNFKYALPDHSSNYCVFLFHLI